MCFVTAQRIEGNVKLTAYTSSWKLYKQSQALLFESSPTFRTRAILASISKAGEIIR